MSYWTVQQFNVPFYVSLLCRSDCQDLQGLLVYSGVGWSQKCIKTVRPIIEYIGTNTSFRLYLGEHKTISSSISNVSLFYNLMLRAKDLTTDLHISCVDIQVCNQTTGWQVFCLHECKFVPLTQPHNYIPKLFSERT